MKDLWGIIVLLLLSAALPAPALEEETSNLSPTFGEEWFGSLKRLLKRPLHLVKSSPAHPVEEKEEQPPQSPAAQILLPTGHPCAEILSASPSPQELPNIALLNISYRQEQGQRLALIEVRSTKNQLIYWNAIAAPENRSAESLHREIHQMLQESLHPRPRRIISANLALDHWGDRWIDLKPGGADDRVEESRPLRFWINNNRDRTRRARNCRNHRIEGGADLEDFMPLHISFHSPGLSSTATEQEILKQFSIHLRLRPQGDRSPQFKLFHSPGTQFDHLHNPSTAQRLHKWDRYVGTVHSALTPLQTPHAHKSAAKNDASGRWYLWEGTQSGEGILELVLRSRKSGEEIVVDQAALQLEDVRTLYARANARKREGSRRHWRYQVPKVTLTAPTHESDGSVLIFIHGFQTMMTGSTSRWTGEWFDRVYKRLYWSGYRGRFVGFSWDSVFDSSLKSPRETVFNHAVFRALLTGDALADYLKHLNGTPGVDRIHLMAHSLGNMVASNALKQSPENLVDHYFLCQAAVAAETYDSRVPFSRLLHRHLTPETPRRSNYFQGVVGKATLINTFTDSDEVLGGTAFFNWCGRLSFAGWLFNARTLPTRRIYFGDDVNHPAYAQYAYRSEPSSKSAGETEIRGMENIPVRSRGIANHSDMVRKEFHEVRHFYEFIAQRLSARTPSYSVPSALALAADLLPPQIPEDEPSRIAPKRDRQALAAR